MHEINTEPQKVHSTLTPTSAGHDAPAAIGAWSTRRGVWRRWQGFGHGAENRTPYVCGPTPNCMGFFLLRREQFQYLFMHACNLTRCWKAHLLLVVLETGLLGLGCHAVMHAWDVESQSGKVISQLEGAIVVHMGQGC